MSVVFAIYVKARNAAHAKNLGVLDSDTINAAAKLHAASYGLTEYHMSNLIRSALLHPMIEHKGEGVTVWAMPVIP